jgi:hypothetical protein
VKSKNNTERTFIIRAGAITKQAIATSESYERNGKASDRCNMQVGQIVNSVFPTKENKEKISYISEINDSLYLVDGTLDNYVVQTFKVIRSDVVDLKKTK